MALTGASYHRFLLVVLLLPVSFGAPIEREFIYPNFTASYLLFPDKSGVFLTSRNSTFEASISNIKSQQSRFYLCIRHVSTGSVVWVANRSSPISNSDLLTLTPTSLSLSDSWSTPPLNGTISALRLLDSGNLVLLDPSNRTLWQTFDNPTDTLVSGQRLRGGHSLTSSVSDSDLSEGDYTMGVTENDVALQWKGRQQYWSMSSDLRSYRNSNAAVSYMEINSTGIFLFSDDDDGTHVLKTPLPVAEFRIAKLDHNGQFVIKSYASAAAATVSGNSFVAPEDNCELPFVCGVLGLCKGGHNVSNCGCAAGFMASKSASRICVPSDGSKLASPGSSCVSKRVEYRILRDGVGYFANRFAVPKLDGANYSACSSLCDSDCECLGFYYGNKTGSCFLLRDQLGSLSSLTGAGVGYVKVDVSGEHPSDASSSNGHSVLVAILIPLLAVALLVGVVVLVFWIRRRKRGEHGRLRSTGSSNAQMGGLWQEEEEDEGGEEEEEGNDDESDSWIPGLPARFTYVELEKATEMFKDRIGSGGFGVVYKGVLQDGSVVAVKKLGGLGKQRRREFCTEIGVIGNIHHVNLVKLRGFCAQGRQRLLVYEYMNRGSLDRSLFAAHGLPVMEWKERMDVALGAARGLAYLHDGCDHKIIHCDVKPENILLHDLGGVKISDFGLSKLLSPEQTSLVTTLRGTRGYLAPEWLANTSISDRADVYGFGMVLLEIVHGSKNCPPSTTWNGRAGNATPAALGESYFPLLALEKHEEKRYEELVDPRLAGRVAREEVEVAVKVALSCLHENPARRPSMTVVVGMLERTILVWEPDVTSLNYLRFYGRRNIEPSTILRLSSNTSDNILGNVSHLNGTSDESFMPSLSYMSSQDVSGPR